MSRTSGSFTCYNLNIVLNISRRYDGAEVSCSESDGFTCRVIAAHKKRQGSAPKVHVVVPTISFCPRETTSSRSRFGPTFLEIRGRFVGRSTEAHADRRRTTDGGARAENNTASKRKLKQKTPHRNGHHERRNEIILNGQTRPNNFQNHNAILVVVYLRSAHVYVNVARSTVSQEDEWFAIDRPPSSSIILRGCRMEMCAVQDAIVSRPTICAPGTVTCAFFRTRVPESL